VRRVTMHPCSIVTVGDPEDSIVAPLGSADVFWITRVSGRIPVRFVARLRSACVIEDRVCPPHFRDARPGAAPELAQVIKQIDGHVASQDFS
jgi:hypothetical protein